MQIDPEITVDAEALKQQVKDSIKKAIENDGVISREEKTALETMYGKELYNQVRQEIMREMNSGNDRNFSAENTDSTNPLSRVKDLARQHIANMRSGQLATANVTGMDMGRIAVPYMGAYQKDENIEADMERGVRNGNEPQNDLIRSMINQLEALNRKQWTVNVNPSSAWYFSLILLRIVASESELSTSIVITGLSLTMSMRAAKLPSTSEIEIK